MTIDRFLEIEKEYDMYNTRAEGAPYWILTRRDVWYDIFNTTLGMGKSHPARRLTPWVIVKKMCSIFYFGTFCGRLPRKKAEVLFLCYERRIKDQGFYECPFTERLSELYPDSVTLERPYELRHLRPTRTRNLYYLDRILIKSYLRYQFHRITGSGYYKRIKNEIAAQIEEPFRRIEDTYDISLDHNKYLRKLTENAILYLYEYKDYEKLLETVSPKCIVGVAGYARRMMIVCEIAARRGIPVVELQQGMIYSDQVFYQYADNYNGDQTPDYFFLFSEHWKGNTRLPAEKVRLISTGYPLFDEKRKRYPRVKREDGRRTILFVSQGTIGASLSQLATELADLLAGSSYRIIYKLHPFEYAAWKEKYPYLNRPDIDVVDNNERNLYELFAVSDIQVGVYSTAMLEGLGYGLESYVYKTGNYMGMEFLVELGCAEFVDSAGELAEKLAENSKTERVQVELFKANALDNMKKEIDRIMVK